MSYKSGEHNVTCDRCGQEYLSSEVRTEWTGDVVCDGCYDPRHEQEFLRMKADKIAPNPEFVRKPPTEVYVTKLCSTRSAIPGVAIPGCAIPGHVEPSIPSGTF